MPAACAKAPLRQTQDADGLDLEHGRAHKVCFSNCMLSVTPCHMVSLLLIMQLLARLCTLWMPQG